MELQRRNEMLPDDEWKWRDKHGKMHLPRDMDTRHLMSTVIMIWNHTAPDFARTHDYIKYKFSNRYGSSYLRQAVRVMFRELAGRDLSDVPDYVLRRWNTLRAWLAQPEFEEQFGIIEVRKLPSPS